MFDYREWCRLCGDLDGHFEAEFNVLTLIQQTFEISTMDTTRICRSCDVKLKEIIKLTEKAKTLERLFEGLIQENDSDLTVKRLNAYRAHFKLDTMIPEDVVVVTNDLVDEQDENAEYILFDVDLKDEQDEHEVTIETADQIVKQEQIIVEDQEEYESSAKPDEEEIFVELDEQSETLIEQDEEFEVEEETYDGEFEEIDLSNELTIGSRNALIEKTDVEHMFTFRCHLCSHEDFVKMNELTKHCKNVHNAIPMVKCCSDECDAVLSTWRRLLIHKEKHFPRDDQLKCPECQLVYLSKTRLDRHMLSHQMRFYCNQCGREFKEAKVLKTHELTHIYSLEERKNLYCTHDGCDKRFSSKQALRNHIAMRHEQQVTNHCKVSGCGKDFFTRKAYNAHMRGVHGERKFACDACTFKATTRSALNIHNITHKVGEKKFKCDICNASFLALQRLRTHMVVHSKVSPFLCQTCPASFKRLRDLHTHAITHTGTKPHRCQFCSKRFCNQPNCRKHKLKEHPEDLKIWERTNGVRSRNVFECYK